MSTGRPSRQPTKEAMLAKLREEEPEGVSRVIFEVPVSKHRQLKTIAAKRGTTVRQLMTAHVDRLIEEEGA